MRPDKGYDLTEKELKALEKRIYDSYKEAYDGLTDIIKEYFAKFADRDASEKARGRWRYHRGTIQAMEACADRAWKAL